jgi:hypothetical protein
VKRLTIAALILLAGCGSDAAAEDPNPSGVVSRMEYDDPDTWTESYQCGSIKVGDINVPTMCSRTRHDGPHWYVMVATDADKVRRLEVGEDAYRSCRPGAQFADGKCVG